MPAGTPTPQLPPDSVQPALHPGVVVATFVQQYEDEVPQISRVVKVESDTIEVKWLTGCYSGMYNSLHCFYVF